MNNVINIIFLLILTILTSVAATVVFTGAAVLAGFNVPFVILISLFTMAYSIYTIIQILKIQLKAVK